MLLPALATWPPRSALLLPHHTRTSTSASGSFPCSTLVVADAKPSPWVSVPAGGSSAEASDDDDDDTKSSGSDPSLGSLGDARRRPPQEGGIAAERSNSAERAGAWVVVVAAVVLLYELERMMSSVWRHRRRRLEDGILWSCFFLAATSGREWKATDRQPDRQTGT